MKDFLAYVQTKVLVRMLSSDIIVLERKAAHKLADLADESFEKRALIYRAEGLRPLISLLWYEDVETSRQAIRAIANLACHSMFTSNDSQRCNRTISLLNESQRLNLMHVLVQLLLNEDAETRWQALRVVTSITGVSTSLKMDKNLVDNFIQALIKVLSIADIKIKREAARAVANLGRHTTKIVNENLALKLSRALVRLLSNEDTETKRQACRTVVSLIHWNYPCDGFLAKITAEVNAIIFQEAMVKARALASLDRLLSDNDSKTRQYATKAIDKLQRLHKASQTDKPLLKQNPPPLKIALNSLGLSVEQFEAEYPSDCDAYKPYYCPIGLGLMLDPVTLGVTGVTYEREHIVAALAVQPDRDPLTNQKISDVTLVPNRNLCDLIEAKMTKLAKKVVVKPSSIPENNLPPDTLAQSSIFSHS